jgi:MarR family transcriptional regulator for hemolysin
MSTQTELLGRQVGMAAKAVRAFAEQQLCTVGESLSVAIITRILVDQPDVSQRELAALMGVEGPTMARHMDRLEAGGLIRRSRDVRDRRILRVRLTPSGQQLQRRLSATLLQTHQTLTAVFSPDELQQFQSFLTRVTDHAKQLVDLEKRTSR